MLKKFLRELFWVKDVAIHISVEKKPIDKNILFGNERVAKERYDFIYNQMMKELLAKNIDTYESYKTLLSSIKTLSNNHWSKIPFDLDKIS